MESKYVSNVQFKYVSLFASGYKCEDCGTPVPNRHANDRVIALYRDDEIVHFKCILCRGKLVKQDSDTKP